MRGVHADREALLSRLIEHYRDVGWWIERPGVEGVDLRLRRDAKVLLLACADARAPATRETVDALYRRVVDDAVDGAILVAPAGLDAEAATALRGLQGLRLLDREALHALLGEDDAAASPLPVKAAAARGLPHGHKTTGLDLLFRAIAVLCAIGFVLAVLALLSRTSGNAGEPPTDPASASKR